MPNIGEEQFLDIYDKYVGKIYRYIYFRVSAAETAQDLTSDVFLKSWQYLSSQQSAVNSKRLENPRAFLYQVARNLISDFYRKKGNSPLSLEEIADKDAFIVDGRDSVVEIDKNIEIDSVKEAIGSLNADYQEVIIWRYLDEMEIKEMAQILEKSEGAVRVLLSRALAALRDNLRG